MRGLARFSFRRRWLVLSVWLAALVAIGGALGVVGAGYDDQFTLPSTESTHALQLLHGDTAH